MSAIRTPKQCLLFKPGHNPHWIQMRLASEDRDHPSVPGRLIELRSHGDVIIEVSDSEYCLWNHDADRLAEAVAAADGNIRYQARWGLLFVPSDNGSYAFCVEKTVEHVACLREMPTGTLPELVESTGGFTVSVDDFASLGLAPRSPNS